MSSTTVMLIFRATYFFYAIFDKQEISIGKLLDSVLQVKLFFFVVLFLFFLNKK